MDLAIKVSYQVVIIFLYMMFLPSFSSAFLISDSLGESDFDSSESS